MAQIACVQMDVAFNDPAMNADFIATQISKTEADLIIFPECALTGYVVNSREEALDLALEDNNPAIQQVTQAAHDHNRIAIFGYARRDGDTLYNEVALIEPGQPTRYARKTHLLVLGYDRFTTPGDDLPVFETRLGRIGIIICYDLRFPEAARTLALKGADIIALPTNWPDGAQVSARHFAPTRAAENRVILAACNRVGHERGTDFIGMSGIYGISGETLAVSDDQPTVPTAEINPHDARNKHIVNRPGEYEMHMLNDRRPDLYGPITKPHSG